MDPIIWRQDEAIRVEDDGNEAGSTLGTSNTGYTRVTDETFRHRFVIQEVGGGGATNFEEVLQFSINGGDWTAPDTTGVGAEAIRAVASGFYVDGDDTTQRVGGGPFIIANQAMTESDDTGSATEPDFAGNDEFECEFALLIPSVNVGDGDTIRLRIIKGAEVLDQYNAASLFDITVDKPAAIRRVFLVS